MGRLIVRTFTPRSRQPKRYVEITLKGIEFVEHWYTVQEIPPHVTRLYQLLLGLIWVKGFLVLPARYVGRQGSVVNQARVRGYVTVNELPRRLPVTILERIDAMMGTAPRWIYA